MKQLGTLAMALMLAATTGCNDHPLKPVDLERESVNGGTFAVTVAKDVDILFVIDNSGSMAEEQATLAANFGAFIEKLEEPGVEANYRIAVTTTDNGHLYCSPGADTGAFQLSSCRSRPTDFRISNNGTVLEDRFDEACASVCDHEQIEVLATSSFFDDEVRPRPWIESINGATNLPDGITATEAFQCFGPQGISGCGYESPLESMRKAFVRDGNEDDPAFGFMRPGAILAVVFLTDEADCSAPSFDRPEAWDPNGEQHLWHMANLDNGIPGSDVCWYAGVHCEDDGSGNMDCQPRNNGPDGNEVSSDESVLYGLDRYSDFLADVERNKKMINPDQELLVAVIGGVPAGYGNAGVEIPYREAVLPEDIDFEEDNGIAPGCREDGIGEAVPPVRLKALADAFPNPEIDGAQRPNMFSVCEPDYTPALQSIADALAEQIRPACVPRCVADNDTTTPNVLDHNCIVEETYTTLSGDIVDNQIRPCELDGEDVVWADGVDVCYRSLTDPGGRTDSTADDMSEYCIEEGWNLELSLERRKGTPEPAGASYTASCSISEIKDLDCPDLP